MRLTFLGATGTVTGSKYFIENNSHKFLVDCGLFQGLKELRLRNRTNFPVNPDQIETILLTHAHLDHSGFLPALMKQGFRGKVYCTPGTYDLCKILLPDSGKLQEEEALFANKYGFSKHNPALPLYTRADAERSLALFYPKPFDEEFSFGDKYRAKFTRAGHIIGASVVTIQSPNRTIVFSGDLGRSQDLTMLAPDLIQSADYLFIESTYGDRLHKPLDSLKQLEDIVNRTFQRGGVLIIPAFSVGRSQTVLYALSTLRKENRIPKMPVYLDSPMSIDATEIFQKYLGEHRLSPDECRATCEIAQYVRDQEESKILDQRKSPMIVISASGMATGGRVLHHMKVFGPHSRNTILFTGYQAAGTRGYDLIKGASTVKIHGEDVTIRAEIVTMNNLSAHADQGEILEWLSHFTTPPRKTFITHGEPAAAKALKEKIENVLHWNCVIPEYLQKVSLD